MWYGYSKRPNLSNTLRTKLQRNNKKNVNFGKMLMHRNTYPSLKSYFKVPNDWKVVVLRSVHGSSNQTVLYFYGEFYFYNFSIPSKLRFLNFDKNLNLFAFTHSATPYCYYVALRALQLALNTFQKPFFLKIRFRGKGYYMYKNHRQTIAPQFGYAHRVYVYAQACSVKFLSKTKILLFGLSKQEVLKTGHGLTHVKPVNVFTGRGIRFARQVIYKKTGKVSTYR